MRRKRANEKEMRGEVGMMRCLHNKAKSWENVIDMAK
jgi:hypothetical protein